MLYDRQGRMLKNNEEIRKLLELPTIEPDLALELLTREVASAYIHGCSTIVNRLWPKRREHHSVGMWIFSGSGRTDSEGQEKIILNDYLCPSVSNEVIKAGVITKFQSFVASPNSSTPVLVTFTVHVDSTEYRFSAETGWPFDDIEISEAVDLLGISIMVRTWNLDRTPAPHIPYSWESSVYGGHQRS